MYQENSGRERRPYAMVLLWTIILVGIGVAIWWAINFGPALLQQQLGGSVPNPGQTIESGQFVPDAEAGWITAFNPREDSTNIELNGRGSAELTQDEDTGFIRLTSSTGGNDSNMKILIPRGVMLPLKGEAATFEVLIKSASEEPHEFAVFCEFSDMGSCGRKRFTANSKLEAQIFDVIINNVGLSEGKDAYLSISTDIAGEGRAIDLYAIRVRVEQ